MTDETEKQIPGEAEAVLIEGNKEQLERQRREDEETDKKQKADMVKFNGRLVLFTGGLLIFSIVGNGIAIYQAGVAKTAANAAESAAKTAEATLNSSNETSNNILEQMRAQSGAMEDAAIAATMSAEIAKDALESQRAWLALSGPPKFDQAQNVAFWSLKNFGGSPAFGIAATGSVVGKEEVIASEQNKTCSDLAKDKSFSELLFPGGIGRTRGAFAVGPPIEYVVGCIRYQDRFSRNRWTKFCYEPYPREPGTFVACFNHNSTDADQVEGGKK